MKESKAPSLGRTPAQKFLDKWQGLIYLIFSTVLTKFQAVGEKKLSSYGQKGV